MLLLGEFMCSGLCGPAWFCVVLAGLVWFSFVLCGSGWFYIMWFWLVLFCVALVGYVCYQLVMVMVMVMVWAGLHESLRIAADPRRNHQIFVDLDGSGIFPDLGE